MKKTVALLLALTLCVALLGGCRLPTPGISSFSYEDAREYTPGGASLSGPVDAVEIEWLSGSVTVATHDDAGVAFSEQANRALSSGESLHYWLDGTTLRIKFCRSGHTDFTGLDKDLTVLLPRDLSLRELEVDSVSAEVTLEAVDAALMDLETVSGTLRLTDCRAADQADLDTTSGAIDAVFAAPLRELEVGTVSGRVDLDVPELTSLDVGTTSGSVFLRTGAAPEKLEVGTVSGSVELCLPENAGFTLRFSTVSGSFSSELPCEARDGDYVCGSGAGNYRVGTTSGSLRLTANR